MADDDRICRICLDSAALDAPLVQPCKCSGTQAHVHVACLQRWQNTHHHLTRRNICPVCRNVYAAEFLNSPPVSPAQDTLSDDEGGLFGGQLNSGSVAMLLLLSAALFVCLPSSFATVAVAALGVCFIGLHSLVDGLLRLFGVRLCFVVDDDGAPLLRIIRVGSQINGLAAGALCAPRRHLSTSLHLRTKRALPRDRQRGSRHRLFLTCGRLSWRVQPRCHQSHRQRHF